MVMVRRPTSQPGEMYEGYKASRDLSVEILTIVPLWTREQKAISCCRPALAAGSSGTRSLDYIQSYEPLYILL